MTKLPTHTLTFPAVQIGCICAVAAIGGVVAVLSGLLRGPRPFAWQTPACVAPTVQPQPPVPVLQHVSEEQQNPTDLFSAPRLRPPTLAEALSSPIPRIVWQTARTHHGANEDMWRLVQAFRRSASTMDHFFLDDVEADALMTAHFNSSVHNAYRRLPLGVMRGDVIRLVVVYLYGGAYADTDTTLLEPASSWLRSGCDVVLGVEGNRKLVTQFAFAATPKHPLVATVLGQVINNIMSPYDKHSRHFVHETTGPLAMTSAILRYLAAKGWAPPHRPDENNGTPEDSDTDTPAFPAGHPDLDAFATEHGEALRKGTGVCLNNLSRTDALLANMGASYRGHLQSSAWPSWRAERDQLHQATQAPR